MNKWLDLTNVSNKIRQSYFSGFVDISGGDLNLRNNHLINIYNSDETRPKFSIKSDQMTVYDGTGAYFDISNSKLIYLKNLTSDVQTQINSLSQLTQLSINNSLSVGTNTTIGGNATIGGIATIGGNLNIGSTFTTLSDAFVGGNIFIQGTANLSTANITTANITTANLTSLTVNGNVVTGGTTSTTNTTIDTWTNTNLINPPPTIVFGNTVSTSTGIYIPWTYPSQIPVGFLNLYLPALNNFSCTYTAKISGSLSTNNSILSGQTGTSYINPNNGTTPQYITGIVLTNVNANTGVQYIQFPQDTTGTKRYAYVYYHANFSTLTADPSNSITAWYSNYYPTTNKSTANFNIFVQAGPPSAPGQPTFGNQSLSSNTVTVPVTYTAPTYVDASNTTTSTATIQNYKITYSSPGSSIRYSSPIDHPTQNTITGTATTFNITGLYPDSVYTVYVSAQNNSSYTSYGPISSSATVTTTNLLQSATMGSISFGGTPYSARLVSNSTTIERLYISNSTSTLTSAAFVSPIHASQNRGSTTAGLLDISASLTRNSSLIDGGPVLTYGGYPAANPGTANNTANYITINGNLPTDSYSTNYQQGFYLQASTTITLGTACFTASNQQSTVTLIQKQKNGGTSTSTTSFNYYYDTLVNPPTSVSTQHYLNGTQSSAATQISGVWVLNGNTGISIKGNTTASNMGQYFFPVGTVISYNTTGYSPATETTLSNLVTGSKTGDGSAFNSSISFSNSSLTYSNNSYVTSIPFSATAYNLLENTTANATAINAIVDYPSISLINSTFATSVPNMIATTAIAGYRVYSAPPQTNTNIPTILYNGTTRYSTLPYQNSWSLTSTENSGGYDGTQELMVANGRIRSYDTTYLKSYTNSYYGSSSQNTADYSTISNTGYRHATFAWKVSAGLSGTNQKLNIVLNNVSNSANNNTLLYAEASKKLLVFFRVEDATTTSTANLGSGNGTVSTYWISANDNTGLAGAASANNYYNTPSDNNPYFISPTITNGSTTTITITVNMPFSLSTNLACVSTGNTYIYVRLGLPMNVTNNYNLTHVSAYLTA